jgi:hypothetical protein
MRRAFGFFFSSLVCMTCTSACIDLKPDVGELRPPGSTGDPMDPNTGGNDANAGNGNNNGNANGPSNSGGNGMNAGGGNENGGNANAGTNGGGNANAGTGDADASMTEPDAGPPDNGCATKDSNPNKSVSFSNEVWMILEGCGCHNSADSDPFAILESGLTIDGYSSLRKGGDNTHAQIIVDGNPCKSLMVEKLGESPSFGDRMPQDGPYLSEQQRQLISDWIAEGARDN